MKKQKRLLKKFLSIVPFLISIPIIAMTTLYFLKTNNTKISDVDVAKDLIKNIKVMRKAIDEYYLITNSFPDLALSNEVDGIEKIYYKKDDTTIYFKNFLDGETIPNTPSTDDIKSSNKIYIVSDFKKANNEGGWNYNPTTGEIHANLPENCFGQGIEWISY